MLCFRRWRLAASLLGQEEGETEGERHSRTNRIGRERWGYTASCIRLGMNGARSRAGCFADTLSSIGEEDRLFTRSYVR